MSESAFLNEGIGMSEKKDRLSGGTSPSMGI